MYTKNTAVTGFPFQLVSKTDGSPVTSGTTTGYYVLDGGVQGAISGTPVHEGNGQWSVDLLAAEMNGDVVGLLFINSNAIPVHFTIRTDAEVESEEDSSPATAAAAVDIANLALMNIGSQTITSFDDGTPRANAASAFYTIARDGLLEEHPWNFAEGRVQLAQVAGSTPAFGYGYFYQLPSDCLRVRKNSDEYADYKIEGDKLLTDETAMYILYTKKITDPNKFSALFKEALVYRLASYLASALAADDAKAKAKMEMSNLIASRAKSVDALQGIPDKTMSTELEDVR